MKNGRFYLALENGEGFSVGPNEAADFSLYAGRELSDGELNALRGAASLGRCKERAMRILGARPMGEQELYERLIEKGEAEQDAAETVAWLVRLHILDDTDYAAMVVRHYAAKGYGPRRVREELRHRKLPRELWDEALEALPEQEDQIDRLLRSRLRGADISDRAALKKASDALLRRGFGWDEIKSAVERCQSE